jgi:NAD(P)-dependent dehydrogenase (short-subunit alcohol dehydrogenase family)
MREGAVIVTGGSRGIGAAIVSELAARDFKVVSLSRSGHAAAGVGIECDVTDEVQIRKAIARVAEAGRVRGLVNNAGVHRHMPSAELTVSEFQDVMNLNAAAVMVGCREIYPYLKDAGGGTIVNIGSFFDKLAVAENLAYCASKAAVGAITRCLAAEWAQEGIGVVNIAPGYVETDLNRDFLASEKTKAWLSRRVPVGRAGHADEVARLVAAIFSENISYLTGETIYLDGGQGINH